MKERLRDIRWSNICLTVAAEREEQGQEANFKQTMTKNFSELMNDSNLQIQEARKAG